MRCRTTALIIGLIMLCILNMPLHADAFTVLCYHDVAESINDQTGDVISADRLIQHFNWLKANGYQVIGIDDLLAAQHGGRPLPDHAVLLTFDDGYVSFYDRVFPLLQAFQYPAVLALVGSWLDAPPEAQVVYGDRPVPRSNFMSWEQLGKVLASGLVEIASHSYGLHRGILANPQGNLEPALTSRRYDPVSDRYEDDATQIMRIRKDLVRNSDLLERRLGLRPRVMVWPFGRYNQPAMNAARELGMPVAMTLESGANSLEHLDRIQRFLVAGNQKLEDLVWELRHPDRVDPRRVVQVDLDYIYDTDQDQQRRNLDQLLDRIKSLHINTVFLQAFADPDGDGTADALYFPNRYLPIRADLFNRVAWQLKTRAGVNVFAWLPVLGFNLGTPDMMVQQASGFEDDNAYRRLSPFHPQARQIILDIYEDLARYADFEGLLFHDDAYLTDAEDANPAALAWYLEKWQMPGDLAVLRGDPIMNKRWTQAKTRALSNWTDDLAKRVRIWRPTIKTARNLFAETILDPTSEAWYAQTLDETLAHNDYAALLAMPNLEQASDGEIWLRTLVERVKSQPGALAKTIFELQTVDWRQRNRAIPSATLADQMLLLQRLGAVNYGYYPDNFIANQPDTNELHRVMSLQTYPYRP
ncbi:MAG: poly-beta-1,6-N-acetyl-D-glucosamine N-deacetylase PgaB [Deltaproteobacteria bacterium]|jgi:biofilm PGA synthesis lipoprotein PgaB|nr:poly-beta-1,6-N-acetyl-D-glucosamine N-deacetylase PgaB [Deltaproteobacteria bacterium]MBW2511743.1 poly-beta-1,6-N-acetyl-D-glucosamine N-deacetylase PgaB [Deltaproteobacteria bacterium]